MSALFVFSFPQDGILVFRETILPILHLELLRPLSLHAVRSARGRDLFPRLLDSLMNDVRLLKAISGLRIAFDFPDDKGDRSRRSSRPLVPFRDEFEDGFPSPAKSDVESAHK
jgi:hypothetical protein